MQTSGSPSTAPCSRLPLTTSLVILDGLQQAGLLFTSDSLTLHIQGLQVNTHLGGYNVLWITYGTYSAFLGHI